MPLYKYKARDLARRLRFGTIEATNKAQVRSALRKMRLVPLSVREDKPAGERHSFSLDFFFYRDKKGNVQLRFGYQWPKTRDMAVFFRQFSSMLVSGVALLKALEILRDQQKLYDFSKALDQMRAGIERGRSLGDVMEDFPNIFKPLMVSMVRAGEASGQLDKILRKLSEHLDKTAKIVSQTKSALYYPITVMIVAVAIITAMLIFVVPTFEQQFTSSGQELPALTRIVVDASNFIRDHYIIFTGIIIGAFMTLKSWLKSEHGRRIFDRYILVTPAIGLLVQKTVVARFCYTLSAMLSAGVNIIEALTICARASNNKTVEDFVIGMRNKVERGESLALSMQGSIFPTMVTSMVTVGEQTGALDDMLAKVADIYEEEVEEQVKALLSLLEPITIVVIGASIGFVVIAMYLPIFDMAKVTGV